MSENITAGPAGGRDSAALLAAALERTGQDIDALFDELLALPGDPRDSLYAAMRHAAIGGGKRLRPLLTLTVGQMFGVDRRAALHAAAAVEVIHVYSLIHDDLPCMDDDDMRRGKPTVHKAFDEATAVLAGDALQSLAFALLSDESLFPDPFTRIEMVGALARASGMDGMVGGQMMDIEAEKTTFDLPTVTRLQQLKTGALISVSVEMGLILARVPHDGRVHLRGYARDIGLAFQIADDLLDAMGDADVAGKALRKDEAAGKASFLSLLGVERAREQAELLVAQACDHLKHHGAEADLLRILARFIIERDR